MISNKSKSIILLGVIMLSSAAFTIGTNNNNYEKNTAVYATNTKEHVKANDSVAESSDNASKITNDTNVETSSDEKAINVATVNTTNIIEEKVDETNTSNNKSEVKVETLEITDNTVDVNKDSNVIEADTEKNDNKIESDIINNENNNIVSNDNVEVDENEVKEPSVDEEDNNIGTDIAISGNDINCPTLVEAPVLKVDEGTNKNGIGDSVYEHLKDLGWNAIDENTIKINDDRLQFKNMNGQAGIDSIITIRCDFEENDKYVLYLLKLMIGDKSISTANPTESEIFSGAFDDTYYDNFDNLVRRIANGSGTIKYSNRNIRVQYDGNWDYTITLTFYNYSDNNTNTMDTPTIGGDINIVQ